MLQSPCAEEPSTVGTWAMVVDSGTFDATHLTPWGHTCWDAEEERAGTGGGNWEENTGEGEQVDIDGDEDEDGDEEAARGGAEEGEGNVEERLTDEVDTGFIVETQLWQRGRYG
ncbi:hypothetical protein CYMTET_24934 [Cymbomonas tetramitiformis]|uniref:Uncharacterized protein n=1 Tax=Cymbomonas tetramitiformis TaxID=36881 RepID=A0AAE0FUV1_9CHLO|nr:hypothetical protein CYMTET_24934 [Cymbomonas tetramitiformis]